MTQSLSAGLTVAQKYGRWGQSGPSYNPPERLFIGLMGRKGTGKTSLFLDHPGALIINMDGSSTPRHSDSDPPPQCQVWPTKGPDGRMVGPDGKPFTLDWAALIDLKTRLLEAAANNEPRPQTLVFDSIKSWQRITQNHVLSQAQALGISRDDKENWRNLQGQSAYAVTYDLMVDFSVELNQVGGYGVVWILHANTVHERMGQVGGEEIKKSRTVLSASERFFGRIDGYMDLIVSMEIASIASTTGSKPKTVMIDGKERVIPGTGTTITRREVRVLRSTKDTDSDDPTRYLLSRRVPLPDPLELQFPGAWESFSAAYRKGIKIKETNSNA